MAEFRLPSLGADMTTGTLVAWKIKPGDEVARGQVVAEIETDKGVIDVECFDVGTVKKLVAEPGAKLPVGAVLAIIGEQADGAAVNEVDVTPTAAVESAKRAPEVVAVSNVGEPSSAARVRATPLARKRAAELGIDLNRVAGSGPDGIVEAADVERQSSAVASPSASTELADDGRTRMRRAIAAAMEKSNREIPHYYLQTTIDVTPLLQWLEAENGKRSIADRILTAVPLLKGVALALRDVPELNGFWIDGGVRLSERVHVGVAIAMKGGGLVAPAIHDTDRKTLAELMRDLHDLIPRARAGRLRSSEMTDATVTLTNLGDLGVETVYGVIYPQQSALVGLGTIRKRPWVVDEAVCVRSLLNVTLAADHRATDGRLGAKFLETLERRLRQPEQL